MTGLAGDDPKAFAAAAEARAQREAAASSHVQRFAAAPKKPAAPDNFGGKGMEEVLVKHVSALQRNKEASRAAGSESPTSRVRTPSRAETAARQQGEAWGGQGLLELQKPHKSRLTREKEAWAAEVHHLRGSNGITATP